MRCENCGSTHCTIRAYTGGSAGIIWLCLVCLQRTEAYMQTELERVLEAAAYEDQDLLDIEARLS